MLRCLAVLAATLSVASLCEARAWRITPDGTGDAPTIQAVMDSSSAGDTVLLAFGARPVGCGPVGVEAMSWGQVKGAYR